MRSFFHHFYQFIAPIPTEIQEDPDELKEDLILDGLKKFHSVPIIDLINKFLAGDLQAANDLYWRLEGNNYYRYRDSICSWAGSKKFDSLIENLNAKYKNNAKIDYSKYTAQEISLFAMIFLALSYGIMGNYNHIRYGCFSEAEIKGDIFASYFLGMHEIEDSASDYAYKMAKELFESAVKNGVIPALAQLANLQKKLGFPSKPIIELYQKGIEQGDPAAMCGLGFCYLKGELGLIKDTEKAFEYFSRAAAKGYLEAIRGLNELNQMGKAEKISDLQLARYNRFIIDNSGNHSYYDFATKYLEKLLKKNQKNSSLAQYISMGLYNNNRTDESLKKNLFESLNKLRIEDPKLFYDNLTESGDSFDVIEPMLSQEEKDRGSMIVNTLDKMTKCPSRAIDIIFQYENPSEKSMKQIKKDESDAEKEIAKTLQELRSKVKALEAGQQQALSGETSFSVVKKSFKL